MDQTVQPQQNIDEEERRRLEEEQRRQEQLIPVLQKEETNPVTGPQGQRIKYYDEGGEGVQRVGEGMIAQSPYAETGVNGYTLRRYSAGHRDADIQDMVYRRALAEVKQQQLNALRESLEEKEADIAAGQQKEFYEDWMPEELSRAYEAQLMKKAWALDPQRNPYPAQYTYEHYHGNGVRDEWGRIK